MDNPFKIFPEELWSVILEELDFSQDIINILDAMPEILPVLYGKQFSLRIGEILPLIFPKLINISDLKMCRQTCRRWNNAISACLQNHPDRHPYKPYGIAINPGSEGNFSYSVLPNITTNLNKFFECRFTHQFESAVVATRNPFPGSSAYLTVKRIVDGDNPMDNLWEDDDVGQTIMEVMPVFRTYGVHVTHMTYKLPSFALMTQNVLLENIIKPIFESLIQLPNLKSLILNCGPVSVFTLDESSADICNGNMVNFLNNATPPSITLETLELCDFMFGDISQDLHYRLVTALVRNNNGVRKLSMNCAHWGSRYVPIFPNLLELCLGQVDMPSLANILRDLKSAPLRKLRVETYELRMGEIISALQPELKIESLEVTGEIQPENFGETSYKNEGDFMASITFLRLQVPEQVGFQFLKRLPSLQFLTLDIQYMYWGSGNQDSDDESSVEFEGDVIRECLHNFYYRARHYEMELATVFKDIWNELPALKMFTVKLSVCS